MGLNKEIFLYRKKKKEKQYKMRDNRTKENRSIKRLIRDNVRAYERSAEYNHQLKNNQTRAGSGRPYAGHLEMIWGVGGLAFVDVVVYKKAVRSVVTRCEWLSGAGPYVCVCFVLCASNESGVVLESFLGGNGSLF